MEKILIIEDGDLLLDEVINILQFESFDPIGTTNGYEGLQLARQFLPDVIVCDILMPIVDGYMVLLETRSDPVLCKIPFIFMTAKARRPDMRRGMELGASDYLTKPFTPRELVAAIRAQIDRQVKVKAEYESKVTGLRQSLINALPRDIQTPVQGILNFSKVLLEEHETLPATQIHQIAQGIDRAAVRMHRLVENYLVYVQLELLLSNLRALQDVRTEVLEYPADTIKFIAKRIAYEHQRYDDLVWAGENTEVFISQENLEKITEEILKNAFYFSDVGQTVSVTTTLTSEHYIIQFTDQGIGMSAEQLAQINSNQAPQNDKYLGLGLLIVQRMVELYAGKFSIEGTPKVGTTITITLRRTPAEA